jgi:uncharacterized membrane protein YhiD involved in acid resistance
LCCCLLFVLAGSVPGRRLRVDLIVGVLAVRGAPTALQGALVGIGFIGAGLVFRQPKGRLPLIQNRTTAAAIFAAAAIGAAAGEGRLLLATVGTAQFRDDESPRRPAEAAADDPQCEAGDH